MSKEKIAIFWFRRDLRLQDNHGLFKALNSGYKVLPIFIFDREILDKLEDEDDQRVSFIHQTLADLNGQIHAAGSSLVTFYATPVQAFQQLVSEHDIAEVYCNEDYEPYAKSRDEAIAEMLSRQNIKFKAHKDHVVFHPDEVLKDDGKPYTVYTPYSKKWLQRFDQLSLEIFPSETLLDNFLNLQPQPIIGLAEMGFKPSQKPIPSNAINTEIIKKYHLQRDLPAIQGTTRLSVHLRFGTVSIRQLTSIGQQLAPKWLNELIWRNFYQMIIWHFPHTVDKAFKPAYDRIPWRNNKLEFDAWCAGKTGYPIVDAGMRELNSTGFMHNRVRMIVASFLTKHLLIDWRWGEAYFARKLLDFELASNNGGWQWAASSGCDAAPYFRVFNPELQTQKFDPKGTYIRKWVPEVNEFSYPKPIVEHKFARDRVLSVFKSALSGE